MLGIAISLCVLGFVLHHLGVESKEEVPIYRFGAPRRMPIVSSHVRFEKPLKVMSEPLELTVCLGSQPVISFALHSESGLISQALDSSSDPL